MTATGAGGTGIGTVTSVGLADASTSSIYAISGSPVVAAGNLTITFKTQTAATFLAAPATGVAAQPSFRAIVATDVPTLNQNTSGSSASCTGNAATATTAAACSGNAATATTLSGTLATSKGGSGVTGSSVGPGAGVVLGDTGTFTPTVVGSSSAGTVAYSVQVGRYWRVGGYCFFHMRVKWTSTTGSGNFLIGGLPLTCSNNDPSVDYPVNTYVNGSLTVIQAGIVLPNTAQIEMDKFTVGTGTQAQALPAAGDLLISGFYPI